MRELDDSLREAGVEANTLTTVEREPQVEDVDQAVAALLQCNVAADDTLLAIGGGSAMDLAKAVAALATNRAGDSVKDYLEGVGRGLEISQPPLPWIAVPTTAGTGSEATKNAVISSYAPPFKKSLRSELMLPGCVLIDPELSISLPSSVTAQSGIDAITQLIESYISRRARAIPQALARQGLSLAVPALPVALRQPHHRQARGDGPCRTVVRDGAGQ